MQPVNIGIIGCGVIAQQHLRAAQKSELIKITAVADLREDAARETAKNFNVPKYYTDAQKLIDDPATEAVVCALPTGFRAAVALKAFAAGKHVLLEKPVAMNGAELRQLIEARGKLVAACCSSRIRFLPSAVAATKLIASGALGQLRVIHCRCYKSAGKPPANSPPAWRLNKKLNGGGILVNWGCYDLDYLLGLCGWQLKPKIVLAQTWRVPPQFESHVAPNSDAESHFAALIRCAGGEMINFERGEYMAAATEDAWRIVGTKGSLRLDMVPGENKKIIHEDTTTEAGLQPRVLWEGTETWEVTHAGPITDFASAIRHNHAPSTPLEKAQIAQQITDAIYASAEKGQAVEIQ